MNTILVFDFLKNIGVKDLQLNLQNLVLNMESTT